MLVMFSLCLGGAPRHESNLRTVGKIAARKSAVSKNKCAGLGRCEMRKSTLSERGSRTARLSLQCYASPRWRCAGRQTETSVRRIGTIREEGGDGIFLASFYAFLDGWEVFQDFFDSRQSAGLNHVHIKICSQHVLDSFVFFACQH